MAKNVYVVCDDKDNAVLIDTVLFDRLVRIAAIFTNEEDALHVGACSEESTGVKMKVESREGVLR